MSQEEALRSYAQRGEVVGADEVLEAARLSVAAPSAARGDSAKPPSRQAPFLLACAALIIVVVAVFAVVRPGSDQSSPETQSVGASAQDVPNEVPSEEVLSEARQKFEEQMRSGWVPWGGGLPGIEGVEVPSGWMRYSETPSEELVELGRTSIYDKPDGVVVGYDYAGLGYVPRDIADSPSFDADAARVAAGRCPSDDIECRLKQYDDAQAEAERRQAEAARKAAGENE